MKIVKKRKFINSLKSILVFIAEDKPNASLNFYKKLEEGFLPLTDNPQMYKRSIYSENDNYRDMTYQGYTIIYKISNDTIEILDIFKWQKRN